MEKTKIKRSRSNKMNVLYMNAKDKLITQNDKRPDSLTSLAFASGDCFVPEPRCRLCSGATHLKDINMDHYDEILSRIFDVEVPDTGKICESCVKCLKVCERFKILVNSSFVKKARAARAMSCDQYTETDSYELPMNPQKEIINLLTASLTSKEKPKRKRVKTAFTPPKPPARRVNIACTICQQKYLMLDQGTNNFVCSRCKHNQLKPVEGKKISSLPANDLRSKNNLMGRPRLNTAPKHHSTVPKQKHQCQLCPKSYVDPQHLVKHVKTMHEPCYECCACGKRMKNKEVYEKHLKIHSGSKSDSYTLKRKSFKMTSAENFETFIRL